MKNDFNQCEQEAKIEFCSMCGAMTGDFWETSPKRLVVLQLRSRFDDKTSFWITCDECHEGLQNIAPPKLDRLHLLGQIRRATIPDQKAVLDWLLQKFDLEAKKKISG